MLRNTCFSLVYTLFAIECAMGALPMAGQTMSLFRQFSTPGMDRATAVAADASGIYVIGNRGFSQGGGVRKYDSRGNELWTRELSVPARSVQLVGAAADATGVYVAGYMRPVPLGDVVDPFVRKYSAGGDELWTRQLEFFPGTGMAVDATGVYVAGFEIPYLRRSGFLRKYNADGAELWTSRFQDPNISSALAADATGVYMLRVGSGAFLLRKWDPRGNDLWTRQLGAFVVSSAVGAADPTGFFVVGDIGRSPFLRRYDADGNELWTRPVPTDLYPGGLVADATGVYLAGTTSWAAPALPGQCRSGSGSDSFVRKYDPAGAELWTRQFGASTSAAFGSAVAVDSSGVYVVGREITSQGLLSLSDALSEPSPPANPSSGAFLARFEKTAAAGTGSSPRIFPDCVVNAASYVGGGVAPGEIVTIFGSAMGPPELVRLRLTEDRTLATTLGGTRILFNGAAAPLLYVSDKQSSAIVPYAVAGRTSVDVQVEYQGVRSDPVTVPVLRSRPGIFSLDGSGQGPGAILNEDGSVNSPSNPARRGPIVSIFGTGGGEEAPGVADGQIVSGALPRTSLPVSVLFSIDNIDYVEPGVFEPPSEPGEVLYAGGSPGSVAGLLQVNVRVPVFATAGDRAPLALIIGPHWTVFQATIALR